MDWFLWFLACMFGVRTLTSLWIDALIRTHSPLPKPSTPIAGVFVNLCLFFGVLVYGGVL